MKGFIKNETGTAFFRLQRQLPVNGILSFDNAYLSVGEKSGKNCGITFVKWLKDNYFTEEGWSFYKEEGVPFFKVKEEPVVEVTHGEPAVVVSIPKKRKRVYPAKGAGKNLTRNKDASETTKITPSAIIEAPVPQAKSLINKTKDRAVLKKALSLSKHFSHKEEHMRLVQKRLEEVY